MIFDQLTAEQQSSIIDAGIEFMRAIIEGAGNDEGVVIFDQITEVLGPDVKGAILFSMLSDHDGGVVTLVAVNKVEYMIEVIKAIRCHTGLGLRESKDVYVAARDKGPQKIAIAPTIRWELMSDLRKLGCTVR